MEKISLRVLGILGITIFIPLFLITFADPQLIENAGKSFIEWKLQSETDHKIDSINLPEPMKFENLLGTKAREFRKQTEFKLNELKRQLKADAPTILATQIAKLRNLDCECRKQWEVLLKQSMITEIVSLESMKFKIIVFSNAKYMEIVENLTLDTRIFLGANSLIFIFFLLASLMKPLAIKHLFLPAGLMLLSTIICSYFYIFKQNWFYTIIYNDYTGLAYIGYLVFIFAILSDILFNKARITTEVLNTCLQAIGHAGSLIPC